MPANLLRRAALLHEGPIGRVRENTAVTAKLRETLTHRAGLHPQSLEIRTGDALPLVCLRGVLSPKTGRTGLGEAGLRIDGPVVVHVRKLDLTIELGELILLEVTQPSGFALTCRAKHPDKDLIFSLSAVGRAERQSHRCKGGIDINNVTKNAAQRLLNFSLTGRRLTVTTALLSGTVHQSRMLLAGSCVKYIDRVGGHRDAKRRVALITEAFNYDRHPELMQKLGPVIKIVSPPVDQ